MTFLVKFVNDMTVPFVGEGRVFWIAVRILASGVNKIRAGAIFKVAR